MPKVSKVAKSIAAQRAEIEQQIAQLQSKLSVLAQLERDLVTTAVSRKPRAPKPAAPATQS